MTTTRKAGSAAGRGARAKTSRGGAAAGRAKTSRGETAAGRATRTRSTRKPPSKAPAATALPKAALKKSGEIAGAAGSAVVKGVKRAGQATKVAAETVKDAAGTVVDTAGTVVGKVAEKMPFGGKES